MKKLAWSTFALIAATAACDGGLSEEEARTRCDQERANNVCVDDDAYQQCLQAYEDCGDDVEKLESCPQVFACPED